MLPAVDLVGAQQSLTQLESAVWARLQALRSQSSRGVSAKRSRVFLVVRLDKIFDAHRPRNARRGRDRIGFIREACATWRVSDLPKRDDALLALLDPP
jgi:hypothetical protein